MTSHPAIFPLLKGFAPCRCSIYKLKQQLKDLNLLENEGLPKLSWTAVRLLFELAFSTPKDIWDRSSMTVLTSRWWQKWTLLELRNLKKNRPSGHPARTSTMDHHRSNDPIPCFPKNIGPGALGSQLSEITLSEQSAKTKKIRRVGWFQISGHAMDRHGSMVPAIASDRLKRALDFEVSSEALGQHPVKEFAERHLQCFLWCCRQLALKLPIHNRCIAYKDTHTYIYIM